MKKWFSRVTPFVILSVLAVCAILYELLIDPPGFGFLIVFALLPALAVMIVTDILLKLLIVKKTYYIWIIEVILIFGTMYVWIIS